MNVLRILLVCCALCAPAGANDLSQTADEASAMLSAAAKKLDAARSSRTQVRALVEAIRAYEVALVAMQGGLRQIRAETLAAQARFDARREHVEKALLAIQSIERASAAHRVWHPGGALASARAGMTMADLVPILNGEAETLRAELSGLATLTALQEAVEANMIEARADMRRGAEDLKRAMVVEAAKAPPKQERQRRLEDLARNAAELGELADRLATFAPVDLEDVRDPPQQGQLEWPFEGEILRSFNTSDAAGVQRPGIIFSGAQSALVLAPAPAEVSYAGPFLDYGAVVVLELSQEYLLVMGGLGELFVSTGDKVEARAPLGLLGKDNTSDEEFLIRYREADSAFPNESLYIELRENGIAVDPTAWFRPLG